MARVLPTGLQVEVPIPNISSKRPSGQVSKEEQPTASNMFYPPATVRYDTPGGGNAQLDMSSPGMKQQACEMTPVTSTLGSQALGTADQQPPTSQPVQQTNMAGIIADQQTTGHQHTQENSLIGHVPSLPSSIRVVPVPSSDGLQPKPIPPVIASEDVSGLPMLATSQSLNHATQPNPHSHLTPNKSLPAALQQSDLRLAVEQLKQIANWHGQQRKTSARLQNMGKQGSTQFQQHAQDQTLAHANQATLGTQAGLTTMPDVLSGSLAPGLGVLTPQQQQQLMSIEAFFPTKQKTNANAGMPEASTSSAADAAAQTAAACSNLVVTTGFENQLKKRHSQAASTSAGPEPVYVFSKGRPGLKKHAQKFTGVYRQAGRWRAQFSHGGLVHQLGMYDSDEAAAQAWDRVAWVYRGRQADLNFPELVHEYDSPSSKAKVHELMDERMAMKKPRGKAAAAAAAAAALTSLTTPLQSAKELYRPTGRAGVIRKVPNTYIPPVTEDSGNLSLSSARSTLDFGLSAGALNGALGNTPTARLSDAGTKPTLALPTPQTSLGLPAFNTPEYASMLKAANNAIGTAQLSSLLPPQAAAVAAAAAYKATFGSSPPASLLTTPMNSLQNPVAAPLPVPLPNSLPVNPIVPTTQPLLPPGALLSTNPVGLQPSGVKQEQIQPSQAYQQEAAEPDQPRVGADVREQPSQPVQSLAAGLPPKPAVAEMDDNTVSDSRTHSLSPLAQSDMKQSVEACAHEDLNDSNRMQQTEEQAQLGAGQVQQDCQVLEQPPGSKPGGETDVDVQLGGAEEVGDNSPSALQNQAAKHTATILQPDVDAYEKVCGNVESLRPMSSATAASAMNAMSKSSPFMTSAAQEQQFVPTVQQPGADCPDTAAQHNEPDAGAEVPSTNIVDDTEQGNVKDNQASRQYSASEIVIDNSKQEHKRTTADPTINHNANRAKVDQGISENENSCLPQEDATAQTYQQQVSKQAASPKKVGCSISDQLIHMRGKQSGRLQQLNVLAEVAALSESLEAASPRTNALTGDGKPGSLYNSLTCAANDVGGLPPAQQGPDQPGSATSQLSTQGFLIFPRTDSCMGPRNARRKRCSAGHCNRLAEMIQKCCPDVHHYHGADLHTTAGVRSRVMNPARSRRPAPHVEEDDVRGSDMGEPGLRGGGGLLPPNNFNPAAMGVPPGAMPPGLFPHPLVPMMVPGHGLFGAMMHPAAMMTAGMVPGMLHAPQSLRSRKAKAAMQATAMPNMLNPPGLPLGMNPFMLASHGIMHPAFAYHPGAVFPGFTPQPMLGVPGQGSGMRQRGARIGPRTRGGPIRRKTQVDEGSSSDAETESDSHLGSAGMTQREHHAVEKDLGGSRKRAAATQHQSDSSDSDDEEGYTNTRPAFKRNKLS